MILRNWIVSLKALLRRIERSIYALWLLILSQLSKLAYKYDLDIMVNNVKSMPDREKIIYSNKLLAEYGEKYFNSALAEHIKAKDNATNFNDFMKAIGKEQKTLLALYNDHKFAAQAIDEHLPGTFKMLSLTNSAYDINALGRMDKVMETFNYAVKITLLIKKRSCLI